MSRILNGRLKITPTFVGVTNNKAEFLDSINVLCVYCGK